MIVSIRITTYHISFFVPIILILRNFLICVRCSLRVNDKGLCLQEFKTILDTSRPFNCPSGRKSGIPEVVHGLRFRRITYHRIIVIAFFLDPISGLGVAPFIYIQLVNQIYLLSSRIVISSEIAELVGYHP